MPAKPVIWLVTPGTRDANNGNWRTAARWSQMLRDRYRVIVQTGWNGERADAMVALHARRSAAAIAAFHDGARRPVGVVLSGTDLYRDLAQGGDPVRSLDLARQIVVLQEDAPRLLEPRWRAKCRVIFQSAPMLRHRARRRGGLRCIVVGHLREEKDPLTVIRALEGIPPVVPVSVRHVGSALDKTLARAAQAHARRDARYRYSGGLPHGLARAALAASDLLIHPSLMEGGANVIVEAVTAGTPVVASRISGNIGMLGRRYPGYFDVGDAAALAKLIVGCASDRAFLARLGRECAARRPLFRPDAEKRAVRAFVASLLA